MSNPHAADGKENAIAKAAGFLVFSGIAFSVLKALSPLNKTRNETRTTDPSRCESTQPTQPVQRLPPQEPVIKKPIICADHNVPEVPESSQRVDIFKGDTLWGLSRKYEVSVDAIKEANGLTGDTIYAGNKLIIP